MMPARLRANGRLAAVAVLCLASGVGAYFLGSRLALSGSEPPADETVIDGLVIPPDRLKVGGIWEDKSVVVELPVRNTTTRAVQVRDIQSSCGCTDISPRSFTVPAGGEATLRLRLDTLARRPHEIGLAERPFQHDLTPITDKNDRQHGERWRLEGVIRSRVTLNRTHVHFGESVVVGQPAQPIKVKATLHVPADDLMTAVAPDIASVKIVRSTDDPFRYDLLVMPKANLPQGQFRADVNVEVRHTDGSRSFGATFPVEGMVQPELRALPSRLLLGAKKVGETATGIVVLQIPPNSPVLVEQIETDSENLHAAASNIDGIPAGRAYRVEFRLTKDGDQSSALCFVLRKSGRPLDRVRVEVSAYGESAK